MLFIILNDYLPLQPADVVDVNAEGAVERGNGSAETNPTRQVEVEDAISVSNEAE